MQMCDFRGINERTAAPVPSFMRHIKMVFTEIKCVDPTFVQ